ncbi:hypothetical protein PR048_019053 [Dryococelus australis]|uniref:Uncharacterized protein n=1 Tax=Dryococelus australis TaxID=614101 RepID=A0ABQ9H2E5_9NEOP|nr:hypothetical protein PR048_019053 [Dryococelus australis]
MSFPFARKRHGKYEDPADSKQQCTMLYSVPTKTGFVHVCVKTVRYFLSYQPKTADTQRQKKGHVASDGRRTIPLSHVHKQIYTDEDFNLVREHVQSFPRQESHYGTKKSSREYLNFTSEYFANVSQIYVLNCQKTDTCRVYDMLQSKIKANEMVSGQFSIRTQLILHQKKGQKAIGLLSKSINESQLQVMYVAYLWIYNRSCSAPLLPIVICFTRGSFQTIYLCIHMGDNKSYMCMWHVAIAGRGGNAIMSCLLKVLKKSGITAKKTIELWCDTSIAQYKNRMLLVAVIYRVGGGYFKTIDIK